jgi:hypothetical protein
MWGILSHLDRCMLAASASCRPRNLASDWLAVEVNADASTRKGNVLTSVPKIGSDPEI